ncbi:MAG: hypothetical protein WC141_10655 [Arcobacteraceae bacterium]
MICKETIRRRKAIYGNNFEEIARLQSEYYDFKVTPKDVAMTLAILKKVRIDFIKSKLQYIKNTAESFDDIEILKQIKQLNIGLEDSIKDYENYLWIATNYKEYEAL